MRHSCVAHVSPAMVTSFVFFSFPISFADCFPSLTCTWDTLLLTLRHALPPLFVSPLRHTLPFCRALPLVVPLGWMWVCVGMGIG